MIGSKVQENENIKPNNLEMKKLKTVFPQYFNNKGEFELDKFKEFLKQEEVDITKEGYGLEFLGKSYAKYLSSLETETYISPDIKHNKKPENKDSENLYIVGDNIDALKHLLNSYAGKIKCIYIDPPYNTGSDGFVYPDNFQFNVEELSEKIGITEEEAQRILNLAGKSTHSAWLTFMYPRLVLARDLLADDGVIFISIDDNEQSNLHLICDEIFGENNFIGEIVRNTNSSKNQSTFISTSHDYCLVYGKNKSVLEEKHSFYKWEVDKNNIDAYEKKIDDLIKLGIPIEELEVELKILTKYPRFIDFTNYWYKDERGVYRKGDLGGVMNGNMTPLFNPLTGEYDPVPPGGYRFNSEKLNELVEENRIHFHTDGSLPTIKRYLEENRKQRPKAIMSDDQRPDDNLMKEFNTPFDNPKQLGFMERILSIVDDDSIILDFFSGSATTAHAALKLNAEVMGHRKFIMVQLPEKIEEKSSAYKVGYRTIDEIGRERIKRAALKLKKEINTDIDYGYKLYHLKTPEEKTLLELESFEPEIKLISDDMISIFDNKCSSGKESILATWLNEDGYGLTKSSKPYELKNYRADLIEKSLYIIDEGLENEDVMTLIKRIENEELDITRIVVYVHSVRFNILQELRKNIKVLRNNKNVTLIERF